MKGTIRPWGADLAQALAGVSGDYALILIGTAPLAYYPSAPAAEQVARIREAAAASGGSLQFHLWNENVEYRWDHGAGVELAVGPDGECELVERSCLLAGERGSVRALLAHAPGGRIRVREFHADGSAIDLKLEALS